MHYQAHSAFGPFWSVTRHADIVAVDKNHEVFSSEPFIVIGSPPRFLDIAMFIAMDPETRPATAGCPGCGRTEEPA